MRIAKVYELLHHQNPMRLGTPTWLPEDKGVFAKIPRENRVVKVGAVTGLGKGGNNRTITLPNNKRVDLHFLGAGHATMAYQGDDGWVYLLTRTDEADPAKEVLTELIATLGREKSPYIKHIPWIEEVGFANKIPGVKLEFAAAKWQVHRMPYYGKLKSSESKKQASLAWRIYHKIAKRHENADGALWYEKALDDYAKAIEMAGDAGKVEPSVADAIFYIANWLDLWTELNPPKFSVGGDGFVFEFPAKNLGEDEKGNLVLLDVFFWHLGDAAEA